MLNSYFAVSAKGIESVTAQELKALNAKNITIQPGGVEFEGDLKLLYQANLHLRTATRILKKIRSFSALNQVMLYDQVRRVHWEDYLNPQSTFAVQCVLSGENRNFNNSHFVELKIKDSIVDRLRYKQGDRPSIDKENPDILIHAYVRNGKCTLSLDSSGPSLHERGYAPLRNVAAPMKETLAAALILLTEYDGSQCFVDLMCGSGTLTIEAALIARNIAPGLFRGRFAFESWPDFDATLFKNCVEQARAAVKPALTQPIFAFDIDRRAIELTLKNLDALGLKKNIIVTRMNSLELQRSDLMKMGKLKEDVMSQGVVVVNPPYGERLSNDSEVAQLYEKLGDLFKKQFSGWNAFLFTANLPMLKQVSLKTSRRYEMFNGPLEARFAKYQMYQGKKAE